jgi:hypothetical protein
MSRRFPAIRVSAGRHEARNFVLTDLGARHRLTAVELAVRNAVLAVRPAERPAWDG